MNMLHPSCYCTTSVAEWDRYLQTYCIALLCLLLYAGRSRGDVSRKRIPHADHAFTLYDTMDRTDYHLFRAEDPSFLLHKYRPQKSKRLECETYSCGDGWWIEASSVSPPRRLKKRWAFQDSIVFLFFFLFFFLLAGA